MRLIMIIFLFGFYVQASPPYIVTGKHKVNNKYGKILDESMLGGNTNFRVNADNYTSPNGINRNISYVLVDSSVHGYGFVVPHTNPLDYVSGIGLVLGYRGWVYEPFTGGGATQSPNNSGFIKAATSPDGITFSVSQDLNRVVIGPGPANIWGPLMGRYPSAVGNEDYPYVTWTEATLYTGSATNNGGRPLYTAEEFGWNTESWYSPAIDLNYGWSQGTDPLTTPGDLWVNCPVFTSDGHLCVTASQWSSSPDTSFPERSIYLMRNSFMLGGLPQYYDDPIELLNINHFLPGGTTSGASMDINAAGTGYAMMTAYLADTLVEPRHTYFIRKTEDHGETWNATGLAGTDYYFMPDSVMHRLFFGGDTNSFMDDTILFTIEDDTTQYDTVIIPGAFPLYDHEVRVDSQGRLHIFSTVVVESETDGSIYVSLTGAGLYHLWTDDPSNPSGWNISQIADLSETFEFTDFYDGTGSGNYFNVFATSAVSNESDDVLWVAYHALADTSALGFNWDIFLHKSMDGGITWSEPINITQTSGFQQDETYVHLAPAATDSNCFMVYSQPDYNAAYAPAYPINWLSDATALAAYQQNIWVATYGSPLIVGIDNQDNIIPDKFSLQQNYPNPFNPVTNIRYSLERSGDVKLDLINLQGQTVATYLEQDQQPGDYEFVLDGSGLSNGVYFYRLTQNRISKTRKMVLMK